MHHALAGLSEAVPPMDLSKILRFYIDKMLKEVPGMKVLVMDSETTQAVSMVYSQSEILEQEVFLVEKLEANSGEHLLHLKASFSLTFSAPFTSAVHVHQ